MKTLHVTTIDLTAWCFLRSWFRRLQAEGHEVVVACTVERFRKDLEEDGARVIHVPIPRRIDPLKDLNALITLYRLFRKERPDVVHTHTSKAGFLGRLAARLAGVPLILHTIHELPQNAVRSRKAKLVYRLLEQVAARWAHHLITVSYANERQILEERICPPNKLTTIREGLELEKYQPSQAPEAIRQRYGIPESALLIGTAARLEPAKGYGFLLEAFELIRARRPDAWLVCAGTGHLESELRAQAGPQVVFTGWVDDLVSTMAAYDIFVLSSLYEGLGIVLLEAMALARPVVSTAVGGTTDVVVDGETGYLVPSRDPQALATRVLQLLDTPERCQQMGAAGRERVEREFRAEAADDAMLALYTRLSRGPHPAFRHR